MELLRRSLAQRRLRASVTDEEEVSEDEDLGLAKPPFSSKSLFEIYQANSDDWYRNEESQSELVLYDSAGRKRWVRYGDVVRLPRPLRDGASNMHLESKMASGQLRRVAPPAWIFPGIHTYKNYTHKFSCIVVWLDGPHGTYPRAVRGGGSVDMSMDDFHLPNNYVARRAAVEQLLRLRSEGPLWSDFAAPMFHMGYTGTTPIRSIDDPAPDNLDLSTESS